MKNKYILFVLLLASAISLGQTAKNPAFLPPFNFRVDSTTLLATWEAPKIVLLNEDFEGDVFPPAGWADTTLGLGWLCEDDPQYNWWWVVPEHSGKQAQVNDDIAPYSNDGSMDYLFLPALDLTVADSFMLSFDSYFDGAYGQTAFVKYSVDDGATWQVLEKMDAGLEWQEVELDLSPFSGATGVANFKLAFYTNDKADNGGWWASGCAIDNVLICSEENPDLVSKYKIFLDSEVIAIVDNSPFQFHLAYDSTFECGILAWYLWGTSDTIWQAVHAKCLQKPDSLTGFAPDNAAILTWSPPWVPESENEGNRDVGEVLHNHPAPSPILSCYGICDDGDFLWISDPTISSDKIYKVTYWGLNTGETITINLGQSWIGDMVSDGDFIYGCLVGGPNSIVIVDLTTGNVAGQVTGDFSICPQMGLAADFYNDEFYIGGWDGNRIWRTDFSGETISSFAFNNVSGLAWESYGGPYYQGGLWIMVNAADNLVTEVDPNNNWATLQSFLIPTGLPYSGAGIEISKNPDFDPGALWLCNQVDNTLYLVDLDEPCCPPVNWIIPENLLGFNVYKDGALKDFVACTEPECCYYIDPIELTDEVINYEVTALYDLTDYGYPADTGESLREGPAEIYSCCFNEMDFFENWSYGWEENYWKNAGDSWKIVQDIGNEAPAAIFSPDTTLINYQDSLQTLIILVFVPGELILSYDISLSAVSSTCNEKLLVQVFDLYCSCWNTIKIYDNAEGSFEWISDTVNITGYFNRGSFRIRFKVEGENSDDIDYWAVDNISARHICLPPENVEATPSAPPADSVIITWDEPIPDISEWKHWDDGIHDGGIGFGTSKSSWFGAAAHWTPEMLVPYKGATITAIGFIPGDLSACFKVAIWSGENKTPVYMQASGNLIMNEWNIITLDDPYPIDITKDLYIGYKLSAYTGYPMSVDDGPAINGFGNSFQNGPDAEWQTILDFNPDIDVNWNIKAFFERDGVPAETFQLFRSINGNEPELLAEVVGNEYADTTLPGYYSACYKLKSSFWSGCISDFSEDTCVVITGIHPENPDDLSALKIYPNPASEMLFIESSEPLESVRIFDGRGEEVTRRPGDREKAVIRVDGLAPGIYLVRVETGGAILAKKVVVRR